MSIGLTSSEPASAPCLRHQSLKTCWEKPECPRQLSILIEDYKGWLEMLCFSKLWILNGARRNKLPTLEVLSADRHVQALPRSIFTGMVPVILPAGFLELMVPLVRLESRPWVGSKPFSKGSQYSSTGIQHNDKHTAKPYRTPRHSSTSSTGRSSPHRIAMDHFDGNRRCSHPIY